jgi:hypothetical protein
MTLEEPPAALSSWGFEDFYDPPIEVKNQTCDVAKLIAILQSRQDCCY